MDEAKLKERIQKMLKKAEVILSAGQKSLECSDCAYYHDIPDRCSYHNLDDIGSGHKACECIYLKH